MRRLRIILIAGGGILLVLGLVYAGLLLGITWREEQSPSTRAVLVLPDGRTIPLVQPTLAPAATPPTAPAAQPAAQPPAAAE